MSVALILLYPPAANSSGEFARLASRYLGGLSEALADILGKENIPLDGRLAGLLSFVYTYHYLNWFIKVQVISWHKIPKPRLLAIAGLSAGTTGIYLYDYGLDLTLLFSLSLLHAVLEFPLNAISVRRRVNGNDRAGLRERDISSPLGSRIGREGNPGRNAYQLCVNFFV